MKNPRDLHSIIKSLSKSEKKHFKMCVNSVHKNEKNYTILFDAMTLRRDIMKLNYYESLKKTPF